MYINETLCKPIEEVSQILDQMEDMNEITVDTLLMVHYAYHHDDIDFDGGLKLIDKLYYKLGLYYDIYWDVQSIKLFIISSPTPDYDYRVILNQLLTPEMIQCYGV